MDSDERVSLRLCRFSSAVASSGRPSAIRARSVDGLVVVFRKHGKHRMVPSPHTNNYLGISLTGLCVWERDRGCCCEIGSRLHVCLSLLFRRRTLRNKELADTVTVEMASGKRSKQGVSGVWERRREGGTSGV